MDLKHTQRALKLALRFATVVPLILMLGGCATSMDKISDPNEPLTALEGIVIGSALVRTVKGSQFPFRVAPMFLVPTHSVGFLLNIEERKGMGYLNAAPNLLSRQYSLNIEPDEEKVFVIKMSAGPHHMRTLQIKGYEDATALLGINFTVVPGKTTYIGRVVFEVSEKLPLSHSFPQGYQRLRPTILIEDAQELTLESIRSTHSGIVDRPEKGLMRSTRQ